MPRTYEQLWRDFAAAGEIRPGGHTDPAWRRGRGRAASFVIRVIDGRLFRRIDRIRLALRSFPFVSAHPDHFLHVTLLPVGFVVDRPCAPDEVSEADLARIGDAAVDALADVAAFTIEISGVNSFPVAPFFELRDPTPVFRVRARLEAARAAVAPAPPVAPEPDEGTASFVPHVSFAYYTARAPVGFLLETLEWFRGRSIGRVDVRAIHLATIDTAEEYPPLVSVRELPLAPGGRADGS